MIANYQNKIYKAWRDIDRDLIKLNSIKQEDFSWKLVNGEYIKYVKKEECEEVAFLAYFLQTQDEKWVQISSYNKNTDMVEMYIDASGNYSDKVIQTLFRGKKGKDLRIQTKISSQDKFRIEKTYDGVLLDKEITYDELNQYAELYGYDLY